MNLDGISRFDQARIEWAIRMRYSPMPELDMGYLATLLNNFRIGEIRTIGKVWEIMMERDGELATNADKRQSDCSGLEWKIVSDGSPDGDKHAACLQYFYDNLTTTQALEQDDIGGVSDLIYQLGSAHVYRYSVHEMLLRVDNPAQKEVTAEFRHTPVWMFESRRGYLGYLQHIFDLYGQPCISGEWLTAVGMGWMRPLCMAFGAKWFPMRDWLLFCSRYGSGFLLGKTDAQQGTKEWDEALAALNSLANDAAVLVNRSVEFSFLDQAAKSQLPFQPLVEMVNGLYAKCFRGVDLATGSRSSGGQQGNGTKNPVGASVQSEESGIFLVRDAAKWTGVCNERVDRPVIRYCFNQEPRAWFTIMVPEADTSVEDLQALGSLVPMGLRIALKDVYTRFHWREPAPGEEILTPAMQAAATDEDGNPIKQTTPTQPGRVNGKPKTETFSPTAPAKTDDRTPIAPGADPKRNPQTANPNMPTPQVDASAFWSRVGQRALSNANGGPPSALEKKGIDQVAAAVAGDLSHVLDRLMAITQITDATLFNAKLRQFLADYPQLTDDILKDPAAARALYPVMASAMANGLASRKTAYEKEKN